MQCCSTATNIKWVHYGCMQTAVTTRPDTPIRCVLCRNEVPFTPPIMQRLRDAQTAAQADAAVPPVQPVLPDAAPLARFRGNALYRMPNIQSTPTLGHRQNDLRGTLFHGSRRGASWRLFQITHSNAHPSDLEAAMPVIQALQDAITTLFANQPIFLDISGAPGDHEYMHSFLLVKVTNNMLQG